MRHYEILANECLPFFTDIEDCPDTILTNWPKGLLTHLKHIKGVYPGYVDDNVRVGDTRIILPDKQRGYINRDEFDWQEYKLVRNELMTWLRNKLTTKALARYVIEQAS